MSHYLFKELHERFRSDDSILRFLDEGGLDGMWYWDLEQPENEWMSPRFWRTLGFDPAEKEHKAEEWQDLIFPRDRDRAIENFKRHCADPGFPYDQVVRYRHRDGSTVWVRCRGIAIRDEAGTPIRMLGVHTDVTRQMLAEQAASVRQVEARAILDAVPSYVYLKDANNKIITLNRAAADAMKMAIEDVEERQTEEFFPADDAADFLRDDLQVLSSGQPKLGIEEWHEGGDGERRLIRTDKFPIKNARGKHDRLVAVATDITDLRRVTEQLKAIVNNMPSPLYAKDVDGRFIMVNTTLASSVGLAAEEIIGKTDHDLFPADVADRFRENDARVLETGDVVEAQEPVEIEGSKRTFLSRKFPLRDEAGDIYATAGISTDLTEMLQLQANIEAKNGELERFVYTASHDLKSPLVTILGFAGLIRDELKSGKLDDLEDFAERIYVAAERMRENIDGLLELSRIGRERAVIEAVSLGVAVDAAVSENAIEIDKAGVSVSTDLKTPSVWCDQSSVTQVLSNLVGNAVKYGSTGAGPRVEISSALGDDGFVTIRVTDNGPGVPEQYADRIFELFQRLGNDNDGTGVGLAIVKRVAQTYGGKAWVESPPSGGASFCVRLPATQAACPVGNAPQEGSQDDQRQPPDRLLVG